MTAHTVVTSKKNWLTSIDHGRYFTYFAVGAILFIVIMTCLRSWLDVGEDSQLGAAGIYTLTVTYLCFKGRLTHIGVSFARFLAFALGLVQTFLVMSDTGEGIRYGNAIRLCHNSLLGCNPMPSQEHVFGYLYFGLAILIGLLPGAKQINQNVSSSTLDQLNKLVSLKNLGHINATEFETLKGNLLTSKNDSATR